MLIVIGVGTGWLLRVTKNPVKPSRRLAVRTKRCDRRELHRALYSGGSAMSFELVAPIAKASASPAIADLALKKIERLDRNLMKTFEESFVRSSTFNRTLVSFQANKGRPVYRWYKFKEGFSAPLVDHLLRVQNIKSGAKLLDPFAGSGTSLFVGSAAGLQAEGIELLPIGQQIIAAKKVLDRFSVADFESLERWRVTRPWEQTSKRVPLPILRITLGAFPEETQDSIEHYIALLAGENDKVRRVLRFALLCVLEQVSFTRKDGQYLRWDYRSGRRQGAKRFDKGQILRFSDAISEKLTQIIEDAKGVSQDTLFIARDRDPGTINLHEGSCLEILPRLRTSRYDVLITSPPYCNRYDYTRTYALELALLGVDEQKLSHLRQQMVSCTVENRAKDLLRFNSSWKSAIEIADRQELLQTILHFLEDQKTQGLLNNNGIPRMVRGYFYEMACVIAECFRVMKHRAPVIIVNDNVRYAGASISVDTILSDIARSIGFSVESIFVLPNAKGNSSQQMGAHGRDPLRKCIYVWRKP